MKFVPFFLAIACSTLSYGSVDKAPKCAEYFSTHQTDGHYQLMDNGLVADPLTGLIWYRCGAGQAWLDGECQGEPLMLPFEDAKDWAESIELAGFDDWRVPETDDMTSLVEADCKSPSINTRVFLGIEPEVYWSSESNFWIRSMAWSFYFYRGHYFSKQAKNDAVRFMLVRN
jgi:hypothetical protein